MEIEQTDANTYKFYNRGTDYTVIRDGGLNGQWAVWTDRRSLGRFSGSVRVLTLAEMRDGTNKTLRGFAQILEA